MEKEINNEKKVKRDIFDQNAPFSNISVGVFSWLGGPVAGGLLTYYTFKKLGLKQYATLSLIGSIIVTIILAYLLIFKIPETSNFKIGFIWPIIYFYIQKNYVEKWEKENLDKKYASNWKAFGLSMLGLILFFGIFFLIALFDNTI